MAKVLSKSEDAGFFAQGGKTKMFGKGTAHKAIAGQSDKDDNGGNGDKWACGGNTKMFGKGNAGHKVPGISGKADQNG